MRKLLVALLTVSAFTTTAPAVAGDPMTSRCSTTACAATAAARTDVIICEILKMGTGVYVVWIVINDQGDVYFWGEKLWDCPPYDVDPGSV